MMNVPLFELVEFTNRNIFLTGKAGTGKTTFLNEFVKKTQKKHIVVAPTGIAAINAGGVTIHSMFGLPLRSFLPTTERIDGNLGMNIADLMQHFRYRKDKQKLLREVEIIIIDEVSMLRADVLDMMDFALRFVRRNQQKFGGVQMLFIGDLYQLPPVVRDENVLKMYYASPFFFDAFALKEQPLITIELTEVYRQKDQDFLKILNAIRDGLKEDIDFDKLNQRFLPDFEPKEEAYVYLTSHNKMAEEINRKKIEELPSQSYLFKASVTGDFKENQFPNEEVLELKEGAQVMFIRNDASGEKKYFNGKLAEVVHIDQEEIWVIIEGEEEPYKLKKETWEQKRYHLTADKNIEEEVIGDFVQYPIRLAWAVTIHKSQGLTFDRLIIDAGKSFASGQVYVALSRCRTLEGIVLKSKITPEIIFSDYRVESFQQETNANDKIDEILKTEKYDYTVSKILNKIDVTWILQENEIWHKDLSQLKKMDPKKAQMLYISIKNEAVQLKTIYEKFCKIILQKTQNFIIGKEDWKDIEEKSKGAVNFFFNQIDERIFNPLKEFYAETKGVKGLKTLNEITRNFLDDVEDYLKDLQDLKLLEVDLFDEKNKKTVSTKIAKIPSHILTYQMFENGKSLSEISKERGLVIETVYGHLGKFASEGVLDISRIITKEKIKIFEKEFKNQDQHIGLNDWKNILSKDFSYPEIRLLLQHYIYKKEKKEA